MLKLAVIFIIAIIINFVVRNLGNWEGRAPYSTILQYFISHFIFSLCVVWVPTFFTLFSAIFVRYQFMKLFICFQSAKFLNIFFELKLAADEYFNFFGRQLAIRLFAAWSLFCSYVTRDFWNLEFRRLLVEPNSILTFELGRRHWRLLCLSRWLRILSL